LTSWRDLPTTLRGAVTKSLLGSAKEISIRWGFFAGFRNYNYQTNPPAKKKESIPQPTEWQHIGYQIEAAMI
jgi:hypothetical protein